MSVVNEVQTGHDWEQAVSEATEHVQERQQAAFAASEKQKPKSEASKVVVLSVLLVAAIAANVWQWTRVAAPMPAAEERTHMAWSVVDVADVVEDFRAAEGRLPGPDEIADELAEDVAYQPTGETYTVTVTGDSGSITFDGSGDAESWARNAWSANPTEAGS